MASAMAIRGADIIHHGFDDYRTQFRAITRRARERFERCDWDGIRRDTVKRLGLHARAIDETVESLQGFLGKQIEDRELWVELKEAYSYSILGRDDFEIAQTYFNSLSRRVFPHVGVDSSIDYESRDFPLPLRGWEMASARMYAVHRIDTEVVRKILEDAGFRASFENRDRDAAAAAGRIARKAAELLGGPEIDAVDVLHQIFIRNKAAYLLGRVRKGETIMPMALAILNGPQGLWLDAALCTEKETSIVFSFARWYFHADIASPREVIGFLHSLLPRKRVAELYISLGYNKHGKTELYADLMESIHSSEEPFVVAPGQPGLVMSVFTLPAFPFVFKVIKDTFPASKRTTRDEIVSKYRQVLLHDRVGRLVDFQEFEHLKFPRKRFDDELLSELLTVASDTVLQNGDQIVIRHVYVGRRVIPLDIFLVEAPALMAERAIIDWGFALKDMAAADIFAGDILLKNFGVTRHGRVVFYDYDELSSLVECRFRKFPRARSYEDELAIEPWFSVSENDVFPAEMETFLRLEGHLREVFIEHHGDLFEVDFWRDIQDQIRQGEVLDFFPYSPRKRL